MHTIKELPAHSIPRLDSARAAMMSDASTRQVAETPTGLTVSGVSLQLGGKPILENINFTLPMTGVTMVMGFNGAGKSLLLRVLHGLIKPTSGHLNWTMPTGIPTTRQMPTSPRQAMVFQKPVLLRRSVAANLDYAMKLNGDYSALKRNQLLEQVGLLEHAAVPARLLSGGEQQRLALIRALSLKPEVLFLDEPTASLDPQSVRIIEDIIKSINAKGTKIVFVTHDIGQAKRLADDIVFLDKGSVVEHTVANNFFNAPESEAARAYINGKLHF